MLDPGWKPALRYVPRSFFLRILPWTTKAMPPRILAMRAAFLAYLGMLAVVALMVVAFDSGRTGSVSPGIAAACVVGFGVYSVIATKFVIERKPLGAIPAELIGAKYMERYFIGTAFAMSVALVGFIAMTLAGEPLLLAVGYLFGVPMLLRAVPTKRRIATDDQNRRAEGGDGSLSDALFVARRA